MSSESLRILRVVSSTYPEVIGGIGLHVHHMSRMQAEMGHDVTVLTSDNGNQSLPREERRSGYQLIRHKEIARPLDNSITPDIFNTIRSFLSDYDVLHIHSHLYFSSNIAALVSHFSDIPVVVTNHGLISQTAPSWIQKGFNLTLGKLTFETADRILCYTETDKQRLRDRGIRAEISVIPNGIDCSQFSPNGVEPTSQFLFVGRLKTGKGPQYLLEAFAEQALEYPDLSLKLVGDGPLRGDLERQAASLRISDQVEFLGEVHNDELPQLYNESMAFVLPSLSEGLPRTVLEAMACSTPVITSALPQLEPLVDSAGVTVTPGAPDQLSDGLSYLIEHPDERERMGAAARKKVKQNYSWDDTVRRTNNVYAEILNER